MAQVQMSVKEFAMYAMIINIAVALLLGLILLFLGRKKNKTKLGLWGLIATVAGGAIAGFFASIPIFIIFIVLIFRNAAQNTGPEAPAPLEEGGGDTKAD
jgi:RsiW-degrading membrane proteinase PrsW (M82 family)